MFLLVSLLLPFVVFIAAYIVIGISYAPNNIEFPVLIWWSGMWALAILNCMLWFRFRKKFLAKQKDWTSADFAVRRPHLWLSAVYTFVCAFRSMFPRTDVEKLCLFDSWISTVFVGRSLATVAELCFVAQWALLLREAALDFQDGFALRVSQILFPMIFIAECFSWSSVITTAYIGNSVEESLWGISALLLGLASISLYKKADASSKKILSIVITFFFVYVGYMALLDVPMYITRFIADQKDGKIYYSFVSGIFAAATQKYPNYSWAKWNTEWPWMTLYFSSAVWASIYSGLFPKLKKA